MKKKVLVIGYFGYKTNQLDGQTLRTRSVNNLLENKYENKKLVSSFDTQSIYDSKLNVFKLIKGIIKNKNIVFIMAINGKKYILPVLYFVRLFSKKNIIVIPIGAYLTRHLEKEFIHRYMLSKMRVVLSQVTLETEKFKKKWKFSNVDTLNNFRLHNYTPSFTNNRELKLVYMARIDKQKGLDVMFEIADHVEKSEIEDIKIDFYGQFDNDETKTYFEKEIARHPSTKYKGYLMPDDIYKTLDNYDLLILPTKYIKSEGFPGTILDAYISGIPVLASNWLHATEFVEDGISGYIRDPYKPKEFIDVVMYLYNHKEIIPTLKQNAYKRSLQYSGDAAWKKIEKYLV
ncbi:MAG: glycosyltransferase [Bacteroidales bacterium]